MLHRTVSNLLGRARRGGGFPWALCAVALLAVAAFCVSAPLLNAGIEGSKHDFSDLSEKQEYCAFCHSAHQADATVEAAPLWNHSVTTKQFKLYNSRTMDATVEQPTGPSRLCLSCHDGTLAIDAYGGRQGGVQIDRAGAVGGDAEDLANDHPIGFVYDDALAVRDGELHYPSGTPSGLGRTVREDLLYDDQMECSSCHDVHNSPAAMAINDHLLVVTQHQSQLCLTCHDK